MTLTMLTDKDSQKSVPTLICATNVVAGGLWEFLHKCGLTWCGLGSVTTTQIGKNSPNFASNLIEFTDLLARGLWEIFAHIWG